MPREGLFPQTFTLPYLATYPHEQTQHSSMMESSGEQTQGLFCYRAVDTLLLFALSALGSMQGPVPPFYHHLAPSHLLLPFGSSMRRQARSVPFPPHMQCSSALSPPPALNHKLGWAPSAAAANPHRPCQLHSPLLCCHHQGSRAARSGSPLASPPPSPRSSLGPAPLLAN